MKKLLLLFTAALTFVYSNSNAQSCTPNLTPDGTSSISPDTIVNLPHATVGQTYSTDIQFAVGDDTMGFDIISFNLVDVTGLPPGFSYTTNPSNGVFPGSSLGCMNATGNPTPGMEGTYPLVVSVNGYVGPVAPGFEIPVSFTGYKIIIDADGTVGVSTNAADKFELGQNIPNPASDATRISFTSTTNEKMELNIFNCLGQNIFKQNVDAIKGSNFVNISTAEFADGIYIYTLRNSATTLSSRMVVSKK
jgi:hypothetical protein